jgi:hypothetical protein
VITKSFTQRLKQPFLLSDRLLSNLLLNNLTGRHASLVDRIWWARARAGLEIEKIARMPRVICLAK